MVFRPDIPFDMPDKHIDSHAFLISERPAALVGSESKLSGLLAIQCVRQKFGRADLDQAVATG
jgi:hypothetical protein